MTEQEMISQILSIIMDGPAHGIKVCPFTWDPAWATDYATQKILESHRDSMYQAWLAISEA